jgi:hypothetical protein
VYSEASSKNHPSALFTLDLSLYGSFTRANVDVMRKKVVRAMITKEFARFILEGVEGRMVVDNERKDGRMD